METTKGEVRSSRLRRLPAYLFEDLAATRRAKEAAGVDVIDLSIGDPDLGPPAAVVDALGRHAGAGGLHRYTPAWAVDEFCRAASGWMKRRFEVDLDPAAEVMPVIGTKEGIAHLPLAVLDPGDIAMVPDPGYPVYSRGVWFAGGRVEWMPLDAASGYLPCVERMGDPGPRLIYLNYPNNPTSAVAGKAFYEDVVGLAASVGALIVSDAAYSEIGFDGYHAPSILEVEGARDVALEFHSFSKTFGMAGWRVGFAAGSERLVAALKALKSNIDSGVFGAILLAAAAVLKEGWDGFESAVGEYALRRSLMLGWLGDLGIEYHRSPATLYIWAATPGGMQSLDFAKRLLDRTGVLVAPGAGFGAHGEGYFRLSITCPTEKIRELPARFNEVGLDWKT